MHRFRFVLYRPVQLIPVLLGISLVTFVLVHLIPGDPARILLGVRGTKETIAAIHHQYGLDRPILVQYLYFLFNLAQGELGRSIIYRAPVLVRGRRSDRADRFSAGLRRPAVDSALGPACQPCRREAGARA